MTTPTLRMQVSTVRANAAAVAASDHMSEDVRRLGQCMAMTCDVVAELLDRLEAIENPPAPVHPLPTRIVPEPRLLPGETLQDYWQRNGITDVTTTNEEGPR